MGIWNNLLTAVPASHSKFLVGPVMARGMTKAEAAEARRAKMAKDFMVYTVE